jgi:hypothetical protein
MLYRWLLATIVLVLALAAAGCGGGAAQRSDTTHGIDDTQMATAIEHSAQDQLDSVSAQLGESLQAPIDLRVEPGTACRSRDETPADDPSEAPFVCSVPTVDTYTHTGVTVGYVVAMRGNCWRAVVDRTQVAGEPARIVGASDLQRQTDDDSIRGCIGP